MPIGGRSSRFPDFDVDSSPPSSETEEQIAFMLSGRRNHRGQSLREVVCTFINELAFRLGYRGHVSFEIVPTDIPDTKRANRHFRASQLPLRLPLPMIIPGKVLNIGPLVIQLIPRSEWQFFGKPFVILNSSQVWNVPIPKHFGGPLGYKFVQVAISESGTLMPNYISQSGKNPLEDKYLDLSEFLALRRELKAIASSHFSWPARMTWRDEVTEYYLIRRQLGFSLSMTKLRRHLVASINEFLRKSNYGASISIHGLPTEEDIENYIDALESGDLGLGEALEISRIH